MKQIKYFKRPYVQVGVRLFLASLLLMSGSTLSFIGAALVLLFPAFNYNPFILATGAGEPDAEAEKALLDKITKQVEKVMEKATKEGVTKAEIDKAVDKLNKDIEKLSNEGMKELNEKVKKMGETNEELQKQIKLANESLDAQSIELKKLKDNGAKDNEGKIKSVRQALKDAFLSKKELFEEVEDKEGKRVSLSKFFEGKGKDATTPEMTIKAVDMFESNITSDNYVNLLRLTQLDPQRVGIPLTIYPHVMDTFQVKGITKPYMSLLVVHTYEDGTDTKPEGTTSAKSSFKFKTVEFKAFFIATYFTLSDETLDDLEEVLDEISLTAPDKIQDKIDGKILRATGDDASDIKGIFHTDKSTAYAAPAALAASIDNANIVDLIAAMKLQCENNKYRPNVVMVNNGQVTKLAAQKNNFADSKVDRRVQFDNLGNPVAICGLRLVQNAVIGAEEVLVYDNRQPWIGRRRDMTMTLGYNGTDLTEGQKTLVINIRLAFGVRDKAAVIYCSNATTGIATLETP